MDMSAVITPKSDQINADDLQGRTITVTVTDVKIRGGQEQPISIHIAESDKVYRPCKSMCRVMAQAWGLDSAQYVGRSMTLYCDPSVKFGPLAVGGIRISHMSHIDGPMTMALTATKGVKKSFKVMPLKVEPSASTDKAANWVDWYIGAVEDAKTPDDLTALAGAQAATLARIAKDRPELHTQAVAAYDARVASFPDPNALHGERHNATDPADGDYDADAMAQRARDATNARLESGA